MMLRAIQIALFFACLLLTRAGWAEVEIKRDVVYGHKDGMALVYDVLQPENANGAAKETTLSLSTCGVLLLPKNGLDNPISAENRRTIQPAHTPDSSIALVETLKTAEEKPKSIAISEAHDILFFER